MIASLETPMDRAADAGKAAGQPRDVTHLGPGEQRERWIVMGSADLKCRIRVAGKKVRLSLLMVAKNVHGKVNTLVHEARETGLFRGTDDELRGHQGEGSDPVCGHADNIAAGFREEHGDAGGELPDGAAVLVLKVHKRGQVSQCIMDAGSYPEATIIPGVAVNAARMKPNQE